MPLKILFADDSMTAQNMGTKILAEAGYEVVAVSNGAAAMKKIAEHKPDIVILDVYMPGYSGLEVCEKLRSSITTLNTPVLLTVGKMEPYRSEDANRVKADGIIIKPFEASDLLAIVKKLEERITPRPPIAPPAADQTMLLDRPTELMNLQNGVVPRQEDVNHGGDFRVTRADASVEVPNEMGGSAAMGEWLSSELAAPAAIQPPVPAEAASTAPEAESSAVTSPAEELPFPSSWGWSYGSKVPMENAAEPVQESAPSSSLAPVVAETPVISETPVIEAPEAAAIEIPVISAEPAAPEAPAIPEVPEIEDTQPIEIYQEPAEIAVQAAEISAPEEPAFAPQPAESMETFSSAPASAWPEPASAVSEPVAYGVPEVDPALVTNRSDMANEFATKFGVERPEEIPVGVWTEPETTNSVEPAAEPEVTETAEPIVEAEASTLTAWPVETTEIPAAEAPAATKATNLTDDDFEARVAAAMAAYDQPLSPEEASTPETAELSATTYTPPEAGFTPAETVSEIAMAPEVEVSAAANEVFVPVHVGESPEIEPYATAPDPLLEQFGAPAIENTQAAQHDVAPSLVHETADEIADHISAAVEHSVIIDTLPANAAVSRANASPEVIADVVHRVMERIKPLLIEEITRELDMHK
ncbi:MAG TPA: response regulator [Candidatus Angelobacter sp.]|nr:response regulator [Candidatus Angelobacter sp.]